MRNISLNSILVFTFCLLLMPVLALAQGIGAANTTTITAEPKAPQANALVTLLLTTYDGNLNASTITWYRDGALIEQGRALRTITLTAPAVGKRQKITVIAKLDSGALITSEYLLQVNSVVIVIEADTHAPPFYKGKALPTVGSRVRLAVFPELYTSGGAPTDPTRLVYSWWSDGGQFEGGAKKVGDRIAYLNNPYYARSIRVVVDVTDPISGSKGQASVIIPNRDPKVLLYENHPLWGIWYNATLPASFSLEKEELTVTAEPYHFTKKVGREALVYEWFVPGVLVPFRSAQNSLVFRPADGEEGEASVTLAVKTPKIPGEIASQQAKTTFTASFISARSSETVRTNEAGLPVF